jgi:hypothetical protein
MKIKLNKENFDIAKREMAKYYESVEYAPIEDLNSLPNFINICPWWDLDPEKIDLAYSRFMKGRQVRTITMNWVFFSLTFTGSPVNKGDKTNCYFVGWRINIKSLIIIY